MGAREMMTAVLLVVALVGCQAEDVTKEFQAKPGSGQTTVEVTNANKNKCTFKFSCNGGTGETWLMKLSDNDCSVYNLSGEGVSYLYFEFAQMSIEGPNKPTIVKGSSEPGSDSEFEMDNGMFQSGSKFNHAVNRLDIEYRDKTHKDL
eukprot:m.179981 g.179981  ORF g.179981 m.179981 type:complete len:148 (+) comp14895_c0_seq1:72-515(+)